MNHDHHSSDFSEPMMCPRYTGIPTFMRTPFANALDNVDIGLIGVPFDGGSPTAPARGTGRARSATSRR